MKNKNLTFTINLTINDQNYKSFIIVLIDILSQIVTIISSIVFSTWEKEYYKRNIGEKGQKRIDGKETSFKCKCGNNKSEQFEYKGYEKKAVSKKWLIGNIGYKPQRIKCKKCGRIEYYFAKEIRICKGKYSEDVIELGIFLVLNMGYHRVVNSLKRLLVNCYCAMTLWEAVQKYGEKVNFDYPKETQLILADGTGVHIGKNKRGKELRLILSQSKNKVFRVSNLTIKDYHKDWKDDFIGLKAHKGECCCIADGDSQIKEGFIYLKSEEGIFQRDLWHIPRQFRYSAWTDNMSKDVRNEILSILYQVIFIPKNIDNFSVDKEILERKEKLFIGAINWCKELGYSKSAKYLEGIKEDLFTIYKSKIKYYKFYSCSSVIERAMREINRREEIGVEWSDKGLLNLMKLKMCQLYNKPLWNSIFPIVKKKNNKVFVNFDDF